MNRILFIIAALFITGTPTLIAQDQANIKFSVYLMPSKTSNNQELEKIKDIHFAFGDINIPMNLKEARQSMAFPYKGEGNLTFFHVTTVGDKVVRKVLCSTPIPASKKKAIILLRQNKGKYTLKAFWFGANENVSQARIVNLTNKNLALKIQGKKKITALKPGANTTASATYKTPNSDYGYCYVKAYTKKLLSNSEEKYRKLLSTNLSLTKKDARVALLLNRNKGIRSVTLSSNGIPNKGELLELQKYLPWYLKATTASKGQPASQGL